MDILDELELRLDAKPDVVLRCAADALAAEREIGDKLYRALEGLISGSVSPVVIEEALVSYRIVREASWP
jgi:hypothetical protein